ncbi:hypothetical protein C9374_004614 [Naegleria lovaniensis]|uniref:GmrSD restriction endonucleases N-terminal domain-containing protein n=1 Tax=Naegleria lovaniensis TaxID=51637 RepID=A0AA88GRL4_NAELO|nr:uncharacterized protein C9374_004614 [Naegleria lovaniensis]KAG2383277.1 hypothetical protein C9374_004614 [Naegleria lovaniensis]
MVKIEPHNLDSFFHSLHSTQIHIPIFQRKFCWLPKYVKTLWNNICESTALNGHHIGKIFLQQQQHKSTGSVGSSSALSASLYCIDGQQRLTTLMTAICAMRDVILEEGNNDPSRQHLFNEMIDKLHRILFVNMDECTPMKMDQFLDTLMIIHRSPRFPLKKIERLQTFHMKHLLQHVRFVTVEYQQHEMNAQERFKDLYHTGKANQILFFIKTPGIDLAQSDLIKNHVLSLFKTEEKQFEMYEKYWLPMERRFCTFENISLKDGNVLANKNTTLATLETLQSRELDIFMEWFVFHVKHTNHTDENEITFHEKHKKFQEQKEQSQQLPLLHQLGMYSSGTEPSVFNEFIATLFPAGTMMTVSEGGGVDEWYVETILQRMVGSLESFFRV